MKTCLQCGRRHNRKKFCSDKCKDTYHNWHNPRGKFAHLKGVEMVAKRAKKEIDFVELPLHFGMHPMEDANFSGEW